MINKAYQLDTSSRFNTMIKQGRDQRIDQGSMKDIADTAPTLVELSPRRTDKGVPNQRSQLQPNLLLLLDGDQKLLQ